MKKGIRKMIAIIMVACLVTSFSITALAASGSFSKETIQTTGGYQVFGKTTLSTSNDVSITQTYAKINGTSTNATVRYSLTRTADGLAIGSEYIKGASSGEVSPWYDNVSVKLLAYSDESSAAVVSANWSY